MRLHDMKRSAKDKRERRKEMAQDVSSQGDDYPHGLRVHLGHEEMEKLGIKGTPKPGDVYEIRGQAKVTHSSQSADENGENRHAEMHFTHMAVKKSVDKSLREELEDAANDKK